MKEFRQSIYPNLEQLGSSIELEGTINEPEYAVGSMLLKLPKGIEYKITLSNTGEGILLQGSANAQAFTQCTRCLENAQINICGEVENYFLLQKAGSVTGATASASNAAAAAQGQKAKGAKARNVAVSATASKQKQEQTQDELQDEFGIIEQDGTFDISDSILAALVEATPFVVLCKDDCKGLCPHCGANLNEENCTCSNAPDAMNPFAALANFKFED